MKSKNVKILVTLLLLGVGAWALMAYVNSQKAKKAAAMASTTTPASTPSASVATPGIVSREVAAEMGTSMTAKDM